MGLRLGVDAVGLEHVFGIRPVGHAGQEKRHQSCTFGLGDGGEQRREIFAVLAAVIRGHRHAGDEHSRACRLGGLRHLGQIALSGSQRQTAKGVVSAQFQHHHVGLVLRQQGRQAGAAA